MAKHTIHNYVMAALEAAGYAENKASRSTKYTEMKKIYLGSGGAVRVGLNVSSSFPVLEKRKEQLIAKGREILG